MRFFDLQSWQILLNLTLKISIIANEIQSIRKINTKFVFIYLHTIFFNPIPLKITLSSSSKSSNSYRIQQNKQFFRRRNSKRHYGDCSGMATSTGRHTLLINNLCLNVAEKGLTRRAAINPPSPLPELTAADGINL